MDEEAIRKEYPPGKKLAPLQKPCDKIRDETGHLLTETYMRIDMLKSSGEGNIQMGDLQD